MLEDRAVLFLDILGFKDLVNKGKSENIVKIIERVNSFGKTLSGTNVEFTAFSDCIVISLPVGDGTGVKLVSILATLLWSDLLRFGILSRGGIAIGKLHHRDNIVVGPALISAYEMESKLAVYPRVLISEDAMQTALRGTMSFDALKWYCEHFAQTVRRDFDGFLHIDTFHEASPMPMNMIPDNFPLEWSRKFYVAKIGFVIIQFFENGFPISVSSKYRWLWNYFSESCARQKLPFPYSTHPKLPRYSVDDMGFGFPSPEDGLCPEHGN